MINLNYMIDDMKKVSLFKLIVIISVRKLSLNSVLKSFVPIFLCRSFDNSKVCEWFLVTFSFKLTACIISLFHNPTSGVMVVTFNVLVKDNILWLADGRILSKFVLLSKVLLKHKAKQKIKNYWARTFGVLKAPLSSLNLKINYLYLLYLMMLYHTFCLWHWS